MKIGICNNESSFSEKFGDRAYSVIKELGFDAVDINEFANTEGRLYKLSEKELDSYLFGQRELAEKAGVEIFQFHGPWRWPPLDDTEERRSQRLSVMKKSMDICKKLGCKNWVIHPIMPFGIEDIGTENEESTWELNRVFMSSLLDYAKGAGLTICLENMPMPKFSMGSPKKILDFACEMNDENFMICLDTGHVNVYRDEKLQIGEETRRVVKYLRCLHIHDNKIGSDLHLFPTMGSSDWKDFGKALSDIGYNGVFSLEVGISGGISDELYLETAKLLVKISKEIISYGKNV